MILDGVPWDAAAGDLRLIGHDENEVPPLLQCGEASWTPGRISRSSRRCGAYGLPPRTIARLITPSRSRNTAVRRH